MLIYYEIMDAISMKIVIHIYLQYHVFK